MGKKYKKRYKISKIHFRRLSDMHIEFVFLIINIKYALNDRFRSGLHFPIPYNVLQRMRRDQRLLRTKKFTQRRLLQSGTSI